jgi:hypothetical protein
MECGYCVWAGLVWYVAESKRSTLASCCSFVLPAGAQISAVVMVVAIEVSAAVSRDGSASTVPGWQTQQHCTQPPLLPLLLLLPAAAAVLLLLLLMVVVV